jgi:hypothetical protein
MATVFTMEFQLFRRTENYQNSLSNHSTEEKNYQHSVPLNRNRSKLSNFCSEAYRGKEIHLGIPFRGTKIEANFRNFVLLVWQFCKTIFFTEFRSVPIFGIDPFLDLGMRTFVCGITLTAPSLFREIFSEHNSGANPTMPHSPPLLPPPYLFQ